MSKIITDDQLKNWSESYNASSERRLATLAMAKNDLKDVSYDIAGSFDMDFKFSIEIPTMAVTNQQATGRCWLFSATNILRERIAAKLNVDSFELSQSFLAFWDKFERANFMLERIIDTADRPTDDRLVQFILTTGVHDGGQWEMFANIVRKYGLVPKNVFDETFQSSHSRSMNAVLNTNMKVCAARLRKLAAEGKNREQLEEVKAEMMGKVYGFLCSCYSEPPKTFDFEYVDKEKKYHAERNLTARDFAEKYVGDYLDELVSIINAPTADKPYHKTYTIDCLGNIEGGREVIHLNLPMDEFKKAIIDQLKDGKIVWFGSDVGKDGEREKGIWDDNSYDLSLMSGLDLDLTKAEGLDYWHSAMNHAMVITGVNLVDDKPTRWKIENSWGDKNGAKGYYICSDSWFDKYVYQAAVERQYLGDLARLAEQKPVVLEAWDPMGTLAD
ncbi:MAG: C1 family peptidase [Erysipelotrichaceae bacterium]|nr:C1 family peptidase [Erysipelotrichaceae bacterium]